MSPEQIMVGVGIGAEIIFLMLLTSKRVYCMLPFFYSYVAVGVVNDLLIWWLRHVRYGHDLQVFIAQTSLDSALQYGVLVELAWLVLRRLGVFPRWTLFALVTGLLTLGAILWPLSDSKTFSGLPPAWHLLLHLQATIAVLRILLFLALAAGSHLLSLSWRDRELQVATGLGLYSLMSLVATLVHAHMALTPGTHIVDVLASASYVASLFYWVVCFSLPERARGGGSPHMESILRVVAESARAQRVAFGPGRERGSEMSGRATGTK